MPRISLIIPYYNHAPVLPRLLRSIAAQSIAGSLEVIIVDDASDMPCVEAAAAFPSLDIRVIRLPERVYAKNARLAGMEAAEGDIIAFADADDTLWGTEALEKNADVLLEQNADIVHFPCVQVDAELREVAPYTNDRPLAPLLEGRAIFDALVKNRVRAGTVWSKLYSRRLVRKIAEPARRIRVRRREDVMFNLLFFWHARIYVAGTHVGYGHHYVDKNVLKAGGRAASCWHMLHDLLPYLEAQGCSANEAASLRSGLTRFMWLNLRLFHEKYGHRPGMPPSPAMIAELMEHMDAHNAAAMLEQHAACYPPHSFRVWRWLFTKNIRALCKKFAIV